ncbi:SRPBCC family protein [Bordetella bronchiseptica]|uniref:SRPBCC family protein n=1 Tax=Bordetella bronchiseptica TaxID=518 RepID=UPI000459DAAE|nr:SRPBCC family protein [Bordetella bronchiseptica]KAK53741.1 carbon monoxide dehydrogenase subunit G CoxG [Bordetella bronchiseptica OSU054]KAK75205.1 carbon monoxide dehydrogenase subunit G CoxG [Bordetella bronchiseptica MO211]KDC22287.1 carbon monoxide dehydrogenase subunit G CoxG [Bordetella bronchiseptica F-1]KDC28779.1 carbon monoxide dehydrogenase subunit G CoxG [Bordetella bronchiseptica F2]KDD43967.1 carbon monoxide dehydrogenase subunit G CoxG [Bordetella bronchiseptica OSU095]
MEFTNTFHVPLPLDEAWQLMLDVPRIMPCLPGARLTEVLGPDKYQGSVTVRLGPIKLGFEGQAELVRKDEATHTAWLQGSGMDPKGRGSAKSEFSFALTPAAHGGTDVTVNTQLALSGAVAQYGRGSGMIAEVAAQILGQFEQNLARSLSGEAQQDPAQPAGAMPARPGSAAPVAAAAPAGSVVSPDAQAVLLQAQAVLSQAQAVLAMAQASLARPARGAPSRAAAPSAELNMLGIGMRAMWARVRYTVGGWFGRRES